MREKKNSRWISNLLFIIVIGVIFFTPVGNEIKVRINRFIAMSPSLENKEDYKKVVLKQWDVVDEEGKEFDFASVEGKVIIINFWATWCPPCIAEKPSFQELYNDYKDKVVFMFVTTDSKDKVAAFKEKYGYTLPIYYQVDSPPALLYSSSIPASYVIDKEGNIVIKKFRAADWNSAKFRVTLDELLK
ncbi:MAG: TlpA family protein disulfide reductase [Flavobacteriaceae bacterium]|jgi:thiol-disulfide isomerase/thioredoxin|nr:TlpA family protein disulfide reductase [Flavobacteriaceae bacterium]